MTNHFSNVLPILAFTTLAIGGTTVQAYENYNFGGCFSVLESGVTAIGDISASLEDYFDDDYWFTHRDGAWQDREIGNITMLGGLGMNDYQGDLISSLNSQSDLRIDNWTFEFEVMAASTARHIQPEDYLGRADASAASWLTFEVHVPIVLNFSLMSTDDSIHADQEVSRKLERLELTEEGTEFECWCPVDTIFEDWKKNDADFSSESFGNPQNRSGSIELQPGIYRFMTRVINESAADESPIGQSMGIASSLCTVEFECDYTVSSADFNGDWKVDGADMSILLGSWGSDNMRHDLNGDGVINGGDLSILLGEWN